MLAKPNLASAAIERWQAAFDACVATGDWDELRALYAPDAIFEDALGALDRAVYDSLKRRETWRR